MIEDIKGLGTELEIFAFGDGEVFDQCHIEVRRATDCAECYVPASPKVRPVGATKAAGL